MDNYEYYIPTGEEKKENHFLLIPKKINNSWHWLTNVTVTSREFSKEMYDEVNNRNITVYKWVAMNYELDKKVSKLIKDKTSSFCSHRHFLLTKNETTLIISVPFDENEFMKFTFENEVYNYQSWYLRDWCIHRNINLEEVNIKVIN